MISDSNKEHTAILNKIKARRDRRIAKAKADYDRETDAEIERWVRLRYGSVRDLCEGTPP